jgi:hypothetical protein
MRAGQVSSLFDGGFDLKSGRNHPTPTTLFESGGRSGQRLVNRLKPGGHVLPPLYRRSVHLIEDIADLVHDSGGVSQTQISQPEVIRMLDFELEVVADPGCVSLPSIRVVEMSGESSTIGTGQLYSSLFPGRAVVVPQVVDSGRPNRGSHLRK